MEFKVSELDEKLAYLAFGVTKTVSQLAYADCVMFNDGKAYTFSGGSMASVALDLGLVGAVNYLDFSKMIRSLTYMDPDTVVDLTVADHVLSVKRGRSVTKLPFSRMVPVTLDTLGEPDPAAWKFVPDGFKQAIKKCEAIFTHQIVSDSILSCINITGEHMEAATPDQVIRVQCPFETPHPFLVKFGRLGKLFGAKFPDPAEYQVCGKWLFFRTFDVVFGIPISFDSFVAIDRFFVSDGEEVVFPDAESLDLTFFQSFYQNGGSGVRVEFQGDKCALSIKTKRGQHFLEIPLECPANETYIMTPGLLRVLAKYGKCSFNENSVHVNTKSVNYAASVTRECVDVI